MKVVGSKRLHASGALVLTLRGRGSYTTQVDEDG